MATRLLRHFTNPVVSDIGPGCSVDWDTGTLHSSDLSGGHVTLIWSMRDLGIEDGTRIRIYGTLYTSRLSSGVKFALTNNTLGELDTVIVTPQVGVVNFDFSFNVDYELPAVEGGRYYIKLYSNAYSRTVGFGNIFIEGVNDPNIDPYSPIPPSGPGGGVGTHDPSSSDDVDFPGDPGVSAVNTGFISLWSPTEQQMLNLSRYMWNVDITTIDFWKRLWADPMDIIYGLNIIPVDFRATGRTIIGGTEHVIVGLVNTKVDMDYLVSQWIDVDCGSIDVEEMWGAYLDYDPYTKLEIYLPYCGYHPLRIDDFMSGSISLKYKIDLLSGACVAIIKATKPNDDQNDLDSVIYQFMGNCATQIPVTASQFADAVRSTMSLAASIGTMVATGVGGAAAAASKQGLSTVGKAQLASSMIGEGAATVENVMGIKPAIERSGALGGAAGLLAVQTPYLILTRPRQAHPETQSKYTGYPSFMTRELSQCFGWTIVKEIHLENIPCTSEEMIEIDNLLKEGVIL